MAGAYDREEIIRTATLLMQPGGITEVRALSARMRGAPGMGTVSGYFDSPITLADAVVEQITEARGVYLVPNVIDPALCVPEKLNRVRMARKGEGTQDEHIVRRRWLPVDFDPVRPAGYKDASSTATEHEAARHRAEAVRDYLSEMGWPDPIIGDSGNGYHLLYRIDAPADDGGLVQRCLVELADRFSDNEVAVDRRVHNPSRIWKCYGSVARKGQPTPERPHRMARIVNEPEAIEVVPHSALETLAAPPPAAPLQAGEPVRRTAVRTPIIGRATRYLKGCSPSIQGENGSGDLMWACRAMVWGFDLEQQAAFDLLQQHFNPRCQPPWSDPELWHALDNADRKAFSKPRGWLRDAAAPTSRVATTAASPDAERDLSRLPWPSASPMPLDEGPQPPPFPVEALVPEAARAFVEAAAATYAVPVDLPACVWLAMAAGAITYAGEGCRVIRVDEGWTEPTNLFVTVALPSGCRKSPTFAAIAAPVVDYESELIAGSRASVAQAQAARRMREGMLKKAEGMAAQDDPAARANALALAAELASEVEPVVPRLFCDDTTPEKLASLMAAHGGRIIAASAEPDLVGIIRGRYSDKAGGANLAPFLKGYSGDLMVIDRVGRTERVPNPRLSVAICAQPAALSAMLTDPVLIDRGMVARWLYSVPKSPLGYRPAQTPPIPEGVSAGYRAMMRRALEWQPARVPADWQGPDDSGGNGGDSVGVAMHPDGYAAHRAFRESVEQQMRPGGAFHGETLSGLASKLPGNVARIAGVMALIDDPNARTIAPQYVTAAIQIGRWAMEHVLAAFVVSGADPAMEKAKRLLAWITRHRRETFSKREAWQGLKGTGGATFRKAADLDAPIALLIDYGYILPLDAGTRESGPGRNPSTHYAVNPSTYGGTHGQRL